VCKCWYRNYIAIIYLFIKELLKYIKFKWFNELHYLIGGKKLFDDRAEIMGNISNFDFTQKEFINGQIETIFDCNSDLNISHY